MTTDLMQLNEAAEILSQHKGRGPTDWDQALGLAIGALIAIDRILNPSDKALDHGAAMCELLQIGLCWEGEPDAETKRRIIRGTIRQTISAGLPGITFPYKADDSEPPTSHK